MSDAERGELVNKGEKRGVKQVVGDGVNVFTKTFAKLGVCGTVLCVVLFSIVLGLALPIASLVIGIMYKDDCSLEKKIPLYLIVAGAGGLISNLLGTFCRPVKDEDTTPGWRKKIVERAGCCVSFLTFINGILGLFLFIWFIMGNVWVFSNYDQNGQCNQTVYWFALITIAISDAIIGIILVGGFIMCCCLCCCCTLSGLAQ